MASCDFEVKISKETMQTYKKSVQITAVQKTFSDSQQKQVMNNLFAGRFA